MDSMARHGMAWRDRFLVVLLRVLGLLLGCVTFKHLHWIYVCLQFILIIRANRLFCSKTEPAQGTRYI